VVLHALLSSRENGMNFGKGRESISRIFVGCLMMNFGVNPIGDACIYLGLPNPSWV
jgi:hypothetical protein